MSGLFFPALLCGILCYLGAIECANPLGTTGSFYCLGRPLVAGLLVGLAFGDVTQGVLCGVAVQAVFIANLSTGGATNSEITYASYGGIGLAMATTKDPAVAVTLSVLIGNTFGLIFYNLTCAVFSAFNHKAEAAAAAGDTKGITTWHIVIKENIQMIFFLFGFILLAFAGLDTIPVVFIACVVCYIIYVASGKAPEAAAATSSEDATYEDADLF